MNFDKYIGLPYQENGRTTEGVDCWGLARLFYKQELNIDLPDYSDLYTGSWDEQVTKLINYHKDSWQEVKQPQVGDLCLFNIYGEPAHIGVYVGENKFLHSRDGQDSVIETLNNPMWKRRIAGYFTYSTSSNGIQITGAPHPLKIAKVTDWTAAGTTIADLVKFLHTKYQISEKLSKRLVLMVDGVPVPEDKWKTTVLLEGQQISYRTIAQGRSTGRLLLIFAVIVAAVVFGPEVGAFIAETAGITGLTAAQTFALGAAAINMAGMALVNAIAPIRPQGSDGKDPGSPNQLNLFNGASNQASRLGAIPIVLGRLRYVGLLGATPFIKTNTSTNILNMLIIWGFGPLEVDDICVGANNLKDSYYTDLSATPTYPITLKGSKAEDATQIENFNKYYPTDVEQVFKNIELKNTLNFTTPGVTQENPWSEISFVQQGTEIDIAFSFPAGMRRIKSKGDGAGDVSEATCSVEIQIVPYSSSTWQATPALNPAGGSISVTAYSEVLKSPVISYYGFVGGEEQYGTVVKEGYRWFEVCLGPGGAIRSFAGASTQAPLEEPNAELQETFRSGNYNSLLGVNNTYTRLPAIPAGYIPIYRICISSSQGLLPQYTVNYIAGQSGSYGLVASYTDITTPDYYGGEIKTGEVRVQLTGGTYYPTTAPTATSTGKQTIWETSVNTVPGAVVPAQYGRWSDFLKEKGIWIGNNANNPNIDVTVQVTLPYSGFYDFEAGVDDQAQITLDSRPVVTDLVEGSYGNVMTGTEHFAAGTYPLRIKAQDSQAGKAAVAFRISFTPNTGLNSPSSPQTIFTIGTVNSFHKRKDPFNYVYTVTGLPRDRYKLRARRVTPEVEELSTSEYRYYDTVVLGNAVCYDTGYPPMRELPRGKIARTAIKVQSTSKANGNVDGINALVQTVAHDWDRPTNSWRFRATNNPASLFLYVLTHPANAYRLVDIDSPTMAQELVQKVDLDKIIEWHNYCNPVTPTPNNPILSYNAVITNTQSIMDTLRDICAAGKASPIFIDGKWSVIIDKPRTHTIQHFTPHNSWGFESTKTLPRIPHAFRMTIQNEHNAYQAEDVYVYNYGYDAVAGNGKLGAEIFEELSLPGVTNIAQAKHLAKWHMAQLKLRPETYTLNTDFEYLVCNRGDLVKVTHDVPLWGIGSGRIKAINTATKTITLTEEVLLQANPSPQANYKIRIRTNDITATAGSGSVYLTLSRITTTGYYSTITVVESIPTNVAVDNLFMLGTENLESQELIVLSIEPAPNLTARITLTDYSPEIYTADLDSDLKHQSNITLPGTGVVENTINGVPILGRITSTRDTSQQISVGTYQTVALLLFSNPMGLSRNATRVQFEMIRSDQTFSDINPGTLFYANKETGNITFSGLETGRMYKVRARYTNGDNTIFGSWGIAKAFVAGSSGLEPTTPLLEMDLENTYIVAKVPQSYVKGQDFQTFEYRLYKDTGVEDFWEITPDNTNNIKVIRSPSEARFNLLEQPTPRISDAGITYRVACRSMNRNNEYSSDSVLGTIVVTTIT
jgi:sulfur carrier protein ThiS